MKIVLSKACLLIFSIGLMTSFSFASEPLNIGASIPDVSAFTEKGSKISLKEIGLKGYLLVYFYPIAGTPGCTAQACSLRDSFAELKEKGVKILGVSTDSIPKQLKFQKEQQLPFTLIADIDQTVIHAFGVPIMFGKASRQAYLFKDGVLVWRDLKVTANKQAEDILAYLSTVSQP